MSAAVKLDPARDARLADLERRIERAHRAQAHAIKAGDALTNALVAGDEWESVQDAVGRALLEVHKVEVDTAKRLEQLRAEQTEVRGW